MQKKELEVRLRDQKLYYKKLDKKFKEAKKRKRITIFIAHNCPYMTKLDKIKSKGAPKEVKGKHYGDFITKQLIKKYRPLLVICGHMHENQGMQKVGKTTVINTGAAYDGKAALIELEGEKIKRVKFIK